MIVKVLQQFQILRHIGLLAYLRYRIARNGKTVAIPIHGKKIFLRKGTWDLTTAMSCFGGEFDLLKRLFQKDYDGIIIDAGGYIGTAAIVFSEMYPNSKVITIEPSTDNLRILKKNVAGYANVRIVEGALTSKRDAVISLKNLGTGEWGFSVVENSKDKQYAEEMENVRTFSFESLGIDMNDVGILKLDIEGGELDLLKNQKEELSRIPVLFVELHDRIVHGCSEAFFEFSRNRWNVEDKGEKYLSMTK